MTPTTASLKTQGQKVVLGFSGGLDTTFCVKYLSQDLGMEVHSVLVDTGGFSDSERTQIEAHAKKLGVKSHTTVNAVRSYYDRVIKYLVFGNVLKNQTYPLSVSAERLVQALEMVRVAKELGIQNVAHGSTGAGNDQVRFDMIFHILLPEARIFTPIRDLRISREEEIAYLQKHQVEMDFTKSAYSINKGLWGTSVGGRETLKSLGRLPDSAWPTPVTKTAAEVVKLGFVKGELKAVNGKTYEHPVAAIQALHQIAAPFGIGRDIHVGDTIIGIKGRVGFEAAAPILIIKAHHLLEKHVLSKGQQNLKEMLAQQYGNQLHEGQILDPVMRDIEAFFVHSQEKVTGEVSIELNPYRYQFLGIESQYDLMASPSGKYGEMNSAWSGEDVRGFSKIFGNQIKIYHSISGESGDQA
jgi:argininosuccinate synthase